MKFRAKKIEQKKLEQKKGLFEKQG